MKKLLRILAAAVLGVGLSAGIVAAQTGTIDTTGPRSDNVIRFDNNTDVDVDNDTDADVDVDTDQDADSGDATVRGNTTGGDAMTGDASNNSSTRVELSVDNSGASAGALSWANGGGNDSASIENTGPRSDNRVIFDNNVDIDVDNETDFDVDVDTDQDADSGDATVRGNTTGGDAVTGSASNTSSTTVIMSVEN